MGNGEKLVKNTAILALGNFLPKLASFAILPILTGQLTKEEYGIYDLITVLVSLFLPMVTLQIQTAAFRFLIDVKGQHKEESRIITNIFTYTLPVSVVSLIVLFFVLRNIAIAERFLLCIYFFLNIVASTERQVVRGLSKNKHYSISAILGSLGQLLFVLIFVHVVKGGLLGATIGLIATVSCESVYLFISAKLFRYIDFKLIDKSVIKKLLAYSWPMVPNGMSIWVMRVSNRLIISIFMGVSANAVFAVANKIPSVLAIAQNTFSMAWQENASIALKEKGSDKYYCKMFKLFYDFMAGAFGIIVAATPLLFKLLVRGDYGEVYVQIPILLMASFFFCLAGYFDGIYVAHKKITNVGITTVAAAACNLLISLLFVPKFGLFAASAATIISYILLCIYRMFDIKRYIKISYVWGHMLIILAILCAQCVFAMQQSVIFNCINIAVAAFLFIWLDGKIVLQIIKRFIKNLMRS